MRFHIVTLFPEVCQAYTDASILGRAQANKKIKVSYWNPRDFTKSRNNKVDDTPYGGGPGMVMQAEPILRAIEKAVGKKLKTKNSQLKTFIMSPRGKVFDQEMAKKLAAGKKDIVLISGRYEGIDARVKKILKVEEISTGPYVLTGGELPALTIVDSIARHIPGVLGKSESIEESRISSGEMYTRPDVLTWKKKNYKVPPVLKSGNHKKITEWKERAAS